jgi:phosphopantetheine adenylyltransferase
METTNNPIALSAASALLLLPPIPHPPTFAALTAAYSAPVLTCLRSVSQSLKPANRRTLDIALPCPYLYNSSKKTRSSLYSGTQTVVANLYKLLCIISVREGFDVAGVEGIDARIILLAYSQDSHLDALAEKRAEDELEGPIVELGALARCLKRWGTVYSVESEQGEQLLKRFLSSAKSECSIQKLRGGVVQVLQNQQEEALATIAQPKYHKHVAVGGTFDHLHIGHKLLLTMVVFTVDRPSTTEENKAVITIGITAEDLLKNKKYAEFLEDWHERYQSVHKFLHGIISFDPANDHPESISEIRNPGPNGHAVLVRYPSGLLIRYVEIWDPFGPTITDEDIDALIISAETRAGGKAVNQKRREMSWKELDVFEVDVLDTDEQVEASAGTKAQIQGVQEAFQNKLSSTEIRKIQAERSKGRSKV